MRRYKFVTLPGQYSLFELFEPMQDKKTSNKRKARAAKSPIDTLMQLIKGPQTKTKMRKSKANTEKEEHITPIILGVPKKIKKDTEKYVNSPYSMSLIDAFRKAAGEYKSPSNKLKKALEKDNFKEFIPSAYVDKDKKFIKRCTSEYSFPRYIGQKVLLKGKQYEISGIDHYYTFLKGHGTELCGTPYDIVPADDKAYFESLEVELEYIRWRKANCNDKDEISRCDMNMGIIEKILKEGVRKVAA